MNPNAPSALGFSRRFLFSAMAVLPALTGLFRTNSVLAQADPLPSWNDGAAKSSIIQFVARVTTQGSPDFVSPAERIATFDNDGTLWAEQPLYFQILFAIDRIKALAPQHPEWEDKEPYAALLRGDLKAGLAGGEHAILDIVMATHAGMTSDEFEQIVKDWFATARHPTTGRPNTEMAYQPMLELLAYLRDNGFKTFIVSGGVEFMRDGQPVLVKLAAVDFIDDKEGKSIAIQKIIAIQKVIGRRPIAAFRNSD